MSTMDSYKQAMVLVHMCCNDPDCGGPEDLRHAGRAVRLVDLLRDRAFVVEWLEGTATQRALLDGSLATNQKEAEEVLERAEREEEAAKAKRLADLEKTQLGLLEQTGGHEHDCSYCNRTFGPCTCSYPDMPRACAECDQHANGGGRDWVMELLTEMDET